MELWEFEDSLVYTKQVPGQPTLQRDPVLKTQTLFIYLFLFSKQKLLEIRNGSRHLNPSPEEEVEAGLID